MGSAHVLWLTCDVSTTVERLTEPDNVPGVKANDDVYSIRTDRGKVHIVARWICGEIYSRKRFLGGGESYIHMGNVRLAPRDRVLTLSFVPASVQTNVFAEL